MSLDDTLANERVGKERLASALFELLEEMPLKKISVADICARAGVSRQTFYRHYESKFDIAQQYLYQRAQNSMYRVGRDMTWHESFLAVVTMLCQEDDEGERLFTPDVYEAAYRCRVEALETTVTDYLGLSLTEALRFQIAFFARAEADFIMSHFARPDLYAPHHFDPERLAELLELCVPRELHDLLAGGAKRP